MLNEINPVVPEPNKPVPQPDPQIIDRMLSAFKVSEETRAKVLANDPSVNVEDLVIEMRKKEYESVGKDERDFESSFREPLSKFAKKVEKSLSEQLKMRFGINDDEIGDADSYTKYLDALEKKNKTGDRNIDDLKSENVSLRGEIERLNKVVIPELKNESQEAMMQVYVSIKIEDILKSKNVPAEKIPKAKSILTHLMRQPGDKYDPFQLRLNDKEELVPYLIDEKGKPTEIYPKSRIDKDPRDVVELIESVLGDLFFEVKDEKKPAGKPNLGNQNGQSPTSKPVEKPRRVNPNVELARNHLKYLKENLKTGII